MTYTRFATSGTVRYVAFVQASYLPFGSVVIAQPSNKVSATVTPTV